MMGDAIRLSATNLQEVYEFLDIKQRTSFVDNDGCGIDYDDGKKLKITTSFGVEIVEIGDTIVECDDGSFISIPAKIGVKK